MTTQEAIDYLTAVLQGHVQPSNGGIGLVIEKLMAGQHLQDFIKDRLAWDGFRTAAQDKYARALVTHFEEAGEDV